MSAIQLYQFFVADINGEIIKGGSLSEAKTITLTDDEMASQTFKVGHESAVKIYDSAENESIGGFDFLWLESDLDVSIQFTSSADTDDVYDVKTLKGSGTAGRMGPALILGSNATKLLDGIIDTFDGTADTIDEVWAYNSDTTETARVRLVVGT